jgi:hypothetical protein
MPEIDNGRFAYRRARGDAGEDDDNAVVRESEYCFASADDGYACVENSSCACACAGVPPILKPLIMILLAFIIYPNDPEYAVPLAFVLTCLSFLC